MGLLNVFFKSFVLGVIVSVPMGPMGILVLKRTLNKGRMLGLISGLGVALADVLFSFIALFGISFFNVKLENIWFRIIGGITLMVVGLAMFMANPIKEIKKTISGKHYLSYLFSAFAITITNPLTILFFAASFAALGFTSKMMTSSLYFFVIVGIFMGAMFWWTSLTMIVGFFHKKIKLKGMFYINKISGIIIFVIGVVSFFSIFL